MMQFRVVVAGTLVAVLWAVACQGSSRWTKSYDDCLKAAKESGRPMVVAFVRKGAANVKAVKKLFAKPRLARYSRLFVCCYVELEIANNQVSSPLFAKYKPTGQIRFPLIFFADANEATLAKTDSPKASDLAHFLKLALHKHGPIADPKKLREALKKLKQADALYEAGKYGPAAGLYSQIVALDFKAPPVDAARGKLAKIDAMANEQLEAARADVKAKAYADAIEKLAKLERGFSSVEAGQKAHIELEKLRKLPEAKEAFAALKPHSAAEPEAAEAKGVAVVEAESRIDGFTDEELDALDAMARGGQASPAPARSPGAGKECRRLLGLARNWIANKRPDKAKLFLRRVLDKHPGTLYADQAKALLKDIE